LCKNTVFFLYGKEKRSFFWRYVRADRGAAQVDTGFDPASVAQKRSKSGTMIVEMSVFKPI
jgi:hypothetical protein